MPRKTKAAGAADAAVPQISGQALERLIPGPITPGHSADLFPSFKKAEMERALGAEMTQHLGYEAAKAKPEGTTNHRDGKSTNTVLTDSGEAASSVAPGARQTMAP